MKLGLFTDAFLKWSLAEVLDWLGREVPSITRVEIGTGAYSPAPHVDMRALLRGSRFADLLPDIRILMLFVAVLLPLGIFAFRFAVRKARQEGSLVQY